MIDALDKSTVISIFPLIIKEEKPGVFPGRFTIAPCNGEPSLLVVGQSVHHIDVGEDRPQLEMPIASAEMARSIVEDFIAAQIAVTENAKPGLTWFRGEVTPLELKTKQAPLIASLKATQRAWYLELVKMADDDWQRYHKHTVISDIERMAARDLGYVDKAWLIVPEQLMTSSCPACGTAIVPTVVVCPNCRCIIDAKRYKELNFA